MIFFRSKSMPTKKTHRKQQFRSTWTSKFPWMEEKNGLPFCKLCFKILSNNMHNIQRHEDTTYHKRRTEALRRQPKIQNAEKAVEFEKLNTKVKTAELRTILFLVEHNLPFSLTKPLFGLIKSVGSDPIVVKEIGCGKTKATETVNGVIYQDGIKKNRIFYETLIFRLSLMKRLKCRLWLFDILTPKHQRFVIVF